MNIRKSAIKAELRQKILDACEELKTMGFEIVHHICDEQYDSFEYFDVNPNKDTIAENIEEIRDCAKYYEDFDPDNINDVHTYMGMAF